MDLKLIRNLVRLMERGELRELEIDDSQAGLRIHLRRGSAEGTGGPPVVHVLGGAPAPAPLPSAGPSAATPAAPVREATDVHEIKSPMVGTFYRSPTPDSDPFVGEGQRVTDESVVCIIEAMKVMNEIRAECRGEVVEILVENGEPVEFGQPLFLVKTG